MIGYHWAPVDSRDSIKRHGLLVPIRHPRIVQPVVCTEGHRNPHISLGKTPRQAWELSGGFLLRRAIESRTAYNAPATWDLWEVDMNRRRGKALLYWSNGYELQVRTDIAKSRITWISSRGTNGHL